MPGAIGLPSLSAPAAGVKPAVTWSFYTQDPAVRKMAVTLLFMAALNLTIGAIMWRVQFRATVPNDVVESVSKSAMPYAAIFVLAIVSDASSTRGRVRRRARLASAASIASAHSPAQASPAS